MLVDAETKTLLRDLIIELRKMRESLERLNQEDTMRVEYDFSKGVRGRYLESVKKPYCDCKVEDFCPKCMPGGTKVPSPARVKLALKKKVRKR